MPAPWIFAAGWTLAAAVTGQEPLPLSPPVHLIDRVLAATPDAYAVPMRAGHALIGSVEQKGVDLVVQIHDVRGTKVFEVDSPNGRYGAEPIAWIASIDGTYVVRVLPFDAPSAGAYDLTLDAPRAPTTRDRHIIETLALYQTAFNARGEALRLQGEGQFQTSIARYRAAREQAARALARGEEAFGPDSSALSLIHSLLGLIDDEIGEYRSGERHFANALASLERTYGAGHAATATTRNDLGYLRAAAGDYAGAIALFEALVAERERAGDALAAADVRIPLGDTLALSGELARAEDVLRRALAIYDTIGAAASSSARRARLVLGRTLMTRGAAAEGEALCRQVAEAMPAGSSTRADLNECLAEVALHHGRRTEAVAHAEEALRIREAAYGPDGPPTAQTLTVVASILAAAGEPTRSNAALERALAIQRARLGDQHPATLRTRRTLAGAR